MVVVVLVVAGYIVGLINLKYWIIVGGVRTIIHLTLSRLQPGERASVELELPVLPSPVLVFLQSVGARQ